jgi:tetratricopeptide (TPR) repeat protein
MSRFRYGPALACLNRWISVEPDAAKPYYWRAWVLERVNDHEGAIKDSLRALDLDPGLHSIRLRLAELYLKRSNPPEAARHLEQLSRELPDRPEVMARLGQCRFLQGKHGEARRLLEAAV